MYVKKFVKNIQERKIAIVDNNPHVFIKNLEHTIPIIPFYGDVNDKELKHLEKFLVQLKHSKDYRKIIKNTFKLKIFLEADCYEKAIFKMISK